MTIISKSINKNLKHYCELYENGPSCIEDENCKLIFGPHCGYDLYDYEVNFCPICGYSKKEIDVAVE